MAPAAKKRATRSAREPLADVSTTMATSDQTQVLPTLIDIFNNSQHVTSADLALNQLKKLHKVTEYRQFEDPFKKCIKKLLQSKHSMYFKTSCDVVGRFLRHLSSLSDKVKSQAGASHNTSGRRQTKRGTKRKSDEMDEIVMGFVTQPSPKRQSVGACSLASVSPITDHDRIISSCIDVADHYMQVADENCRHNAVYFICKFIHHIESLDEEIYDALKSTLPMRIRDRKPLIRAQAVIASRNFQDNKMTQEGFVYHFERDPEPAVRKALLQVMDPKVFGYGFLVDSTQDSHSNMRKIAFQRLGKAQLTELSSDQIHLVIRNGLNERERQASYVFKSVTLESWLSSLYDGIDLHKLLSSLDVLNYHDDVCRTLQLIYERDLDKVENNGTSTKLHHVVESFRERWLTFDNRCLPSTGQLDINVVTIWLTLLKFCKSNRSMIKPIKVRPVESHKDHDANESIEKILDSQNKKDDVAELYERLTPDLVNLVDFLKRFVQYADQELKKNHQKAAELEFVYQELMQFVNSYEVGDELERKIVQEVFGYILKENLLTGRFQNFIPPIIKSLSTLIYSSSSNIMINYISEMINNVRSHLEDLLSSTTPLRTLSHSTIAAPSKTPKSTKKVRITVPGRRATEDHQNLEFKIATIRVDLEEYKDQYDNYIKEKDFDNAKLIDGKISDLKAELALLHNRRCSIASDVSHMSMVLVPEPSADCKMSSTMIGDASMNESSMSSQAKEDVKLFKHHTNELIKCLQMYHGCLENAKITQVPQTMLNHLSNLSYECLDEWFKNNYQVRSLMVACHGLTALVDRQFAEHPTTKTLLTSACFDPSSIEVRTAGFKGLVDVICQHEDLDIPINQLERFLKSHLREYGKYYPNSTKKNEFDFITALIEGTTKLYYFQKIASPEILAHLILWWYHPRTHSRLKQFIGIFLPTFVSDLLKKGTSVEDVSWLKDLLSETFVTSIEYLHAYILMEGYNIMLANDIVNLIGFLCNLIPVSFHEDTSNRTEEKMGEIVSKNPDLFKYLKQAKNSLNPAANAKGSGQTTLVCPLETVDD